MLIAPTANDLVFGAGRNLDILVVQERICRHAQNECASKRETEEQGIRRRVTEPSLQSTRRKGSRVNYCKRFLC
jgi:hypothetical protein